MNQKLINILTSPQLLSYKFKRSSWGKLNGSNKYSIVCAVYGVEKYLEKFFSSVVNQSLNFEEYIELIMVDDGSLDNSETIIKQWIEQYPNNITYIKKENGGQASARNLGMSHVSHDWVTFIDPDDFIGADYFFEVDKFISKENNVELVSCNFILYLEKSNTFSDTHSLKHRFIKDETVITTDSIEENIQLSVNSAFFKVDLIKKDELKMSSSVRPSFEDGHFVGRYMLSVPGMRIGFLKAAKYFYRKREDESSTLDKAWSNSSKYYDQLRYGYLDLQNYALKKKGDIPGYIQKVILYDLIWYLKYIVNNRDRLSFLESKQIDSFKELLKKIFLKIDSDIITNFSLAGCNDSHKVGILGLFKAETSPMSVVEILAIDLFKKQIKCRYYCYSENSLDAIFKLGNKIIPPAHQKIRAHDFLGEHFVFEKIVWMPIGDGSLDFSVKIEDATTDFIIGEKPCRNSISIKKIQGHFESSIGAKQYSSSIRVLRFLAGLSSYLPKYQNAWVFIDRDVQADDNAEHLYRYVQRKNTKTNIRFILRKDSHDWQRLKRDGFNLIPFGSVRHMIILFNARHLISSHADVYVFDFPPQSWFKGILKYHYTFLQHGVIKDDLSSWLNEKPIDLFVTTSEREYLSIAGEKNRYKYTPKEVCLTGLARHDALLEKYQSRSTTNKKMTLLIIPTWRQNVTGKTLWMSNKRDINNNFYDSQFARSWKRLLHSKLLKQLITDYDLDVTFFPHANITPYIDWFEIPSYIKSVVHQKDSSIQNLFVEASVMLTDYSSVAFEMAYLEKPVIYYQFDSDDVFGGVHTTSKGYYDYINDGFGPVCETEDALLAKLKEILGNGAKLEKKYLERTKQTFKFKDGKCCKRIVDAILDLDKPST